MIKTAFDADALDHAAEALKHAGDTLIVCHVHPDGDAVGSAAAMKLLMQSMGKRARILCADKFIKKHEFLLDYGCDDGDFAPEFLVAVDCATLERTGNAVSGAKYDLLIDHHLSGDSFAKLNVVEPSAAATGEIITALYEKLGVDMTREAADALFTAISTDTGSFQFSNVTENTFLCAAKLAACGARCSKLADLFFRTKSKLRMEIESEFIKRTEFFCADSIAATIVDDAFIRDFGGNEDDFDDLIQLSAGIDSVKAAIVATQKENGTKISLRTRESVPSNDICAVFNGGGHARAAGCFISSDIRSALASFVEETKKHINLLDI